MTSIIATLVSSDVETLSGICKKHLDRQRLIEEGCTHCEMFISGNVITLVEQWKTDEDYVIHQNSENLKLFKTLIEPLIDSPNI